MKLYTQESQNYRDRLVVEAHASGQKQSAIAAMYGFHQSTISRILRMYRSNGDQLPLVRSNNAGKKPMLSEAQKSELKAFVSQGAVAMGFETECWDRARVKQLIEGKFKVSYHISHISKVMASIGYTLQKPLRYDYRQDAARKEEWKNKQLPALKKSGGGGLLVPIR